MLRFVAAVVFACLSTSTYAACVSSEIAGAWTAYGKGNRSTAQCRLIVAANGTVNATNSKCTIRRTKSSFPASLVTVTLKVSGSVELVSSAACLYSATIRTPGARGYLGSGQFTLSPDKQSLAGSGFGNEPRAPNGPFGTRPPIVFAFSAVRN